MVAVAASEGGGASWHTPQTAHGRTASDSFVFTLPVAFRGLVELRPYERSECPAIRRKHGSWVGILGAPPAESRSKPLERGPGVSAFVSTFLPQRDGGRKPARSSSGRRSQPSMAWRPSSSCFGSALHGKQHSAERYCAGDVVGDARSS